MSFRFRGQFVEAHAAVVCEHWEKGGAGAVKLAEAMMSACAEESCFSFLYPLKQSIRVTTDIHVP